MRPKANHNAKPANLDVPQKVRFSEIPKIVPPRRSDNQLPKYNVAAQDKKEPHNLEMSFSYSMILTFCRHSFYHCRSITLKDVGTLEVRGLQITGSFSLIRSNLILKDCIFENPMEGVDYFVIASDRSKCDILNSSFYNTKLFGLCADDFSELNLESCIIWKCGQANISVNGNSKCNAINTTISDCQTNLVVVKTDSEINFINCVMKDSVKKGLNVTNGSVKLQNCFFSNNGSGAVFLSKSSSNIFNNCKIMESNGVSISVEKSRLVLVDTQIEDSKKGSMRVNQESHININNCTFSGSKWSIISVYDRSKLYSTNTIFENSPVRGVNAYDQSTVNLKSCIIRHCTENGVRVVGTQKVNIEDCIISNCRVSGVDICDNGFAIVTKSIFSGGFEKGINIYTGGSCSANDTFIFGPFRHAISIHHGGFGNFSNVIFHDLPNPIKFNRIREYAGHLVFVRALDNALPVLETYDYIERKPKNDHRFFKIETKWFTSATQCYIADVGEYELIANQLRVRNKRIKEDIHADCKYCGKKTTGFHFSPCGHCVVCAECWENFDGKRPKRCPLCRSTIEKTVSRIDCNNDDICPICYDNHSNAIVLPCGHSICIECANTWFKTSAQCPFCRESNAKVRCFVPYD